MEVIIVIGLVVLFLAGRRIKKEIDKRVDRKKKQQRANHFKNR